MVNRNIHSPSKLFACIAVALLVAAFVWDARAEEPEPPPNHEALINTALRRPISCEFKDTPLADVADFLHEKLGVAVELDTTALDGVNVGTDCPITIRTTGISARSTLRILIRQVDPTLTYSIMNGALMITTREAAEENLQTLLYPVWDLAGGPPARDYDSLVELITRTVEPNSWDEVGGPGSIAALPQFGCLVVSQTREVQEKIPTMLRPLRAIERNRSASSKPAVDDDPTSWPCIS